MEPNKFSLEHIKNEVLTLTSDNPYYEDDFERKFQAKFSPYNQIFEHPEEELIGSKGKQQMEPNKLLSEHIKNEVLNLTSET